MALLIVLSSCAAVPQTGLYTIDIPRDDKRLSPSPDGPALAVRVRAPRYLEQAYIAERSSPHALALSRYARWDSPPDRIVAGALRDALSGAGRFSEVEVFGNAPKGRHTLEVELKQFELSGEAGAFYALFAMDATLFSPEGAELWRGSFSKKSPLPGRNFEALAGELSLSLANAVKGARDGAVGVVEER